LDTGDRRANCGGDGGEPRFEKKPRMRAVWGLNV
jgi:hypothetical protein